VYVYLSVSILNSAHLAPVMPCFWPSNQEVKYIFYDVAMLFHNLLENYLKNVAYFNRFITIPHIRFLYYWR